MPSRDPIPVYVFTGFLESGKTQFIKEIIADPGFTENERTALLLCEEGIEEYDEREMLHYGTAIVPIESADRLTPNILKRVEQKFDPDRIMSNTTVCGSWTTCSPPSRRAGSCTRS